MKKFLSRGYVFLILAFMYAPIFLLVIYSFTESPIIGKWDGFSFKLYAKLFTNIKLRTMIINTFLLALESAVISTILGTMGAIGIFYSKGKFGKIVKGVNQIPVINAEIVTAISLALVFSFFSMRGTYFALLIGHVVLSTPFVVLSVLPKLQQMDGSLYEAALDLGATPLQALFKVVIPEILPGIFSGFMLAVTLSLDDYMISAFTKPGSFDTISTYVYSAVKNQSKSQLPALRALSSIIFFVIVIAVVIMNIRASRKNKTNNVKI